jgi:DNA-directed RNA polymerase subunit RPC12/RpoP
MRKLKYECVGCMKMFEQEEIGSPYVVCPTCSFISVRYLAKVKNKLESQRRQNDDIFDEESILNKIDESVLT